MLRLVSSIAMAGLGMLLLGLVRPGAALGQTSAAEASFAPNLLPVLEARRASGEIRIDGDITDPGWRDAARAGNFAESSPGDNAPPAVATEVLVAYDDERLYLAYLAQDDPAAVRASLHDRDEIWSDDYIGIILDTYSDAAWAYELFVNPLGIQGDLRWAANEEDIRFDLVWESRGMLTERGYQVEVAVPFASLRFPGGPAQSWRATFWRTRPRESRYTYSWASIDRDNPCWPCSFGTIAGIENVKPGKSLELLPSFIAHRASHLHDAADVRSGLAWERPDADASLGARYAITSSLSIEGALNPDFSQVESDAAQIDVNTTFGLFYPERRPFFQEGSDLYTSWLPAVYTRSINDPAVAMKLTGRMGRTSFAWLAARDERSPIILPFEERSVILESGSSTSNVTRYRRNIGEDSFLGALVTDRRWDDGSSGTLLSGDGSVRVLKNYRIRWQAAASRTDEPGDSTLATAGTPDRFDGGRHTGGFDGERYWGRGLYAGLARDARIWNANLEYWERSPTFRTPNGSLFRNDNREANLWTGLLFRPNTKIVDGLTPSLVAGRRWDFRGTWKDEWLIPEIELLVKGPAEITLNYLVSRERFRGVRFDGIRRFSVGLQSTMSEVIRGEVNVTHGRFIARTLDVPVLGRGTTVGIGGTIQLFGRLTVQPEYERSSLRRPDDDAEIFDDYVLRTRTSIQFNRETFLRLVVQYDGFDDQIDVEPLLSYKANPFTIFYLGWTESYEDPQGRADPVATKRQVFLKLQYLVQV